MHVGVKIGPANDPGVGRAAQEAENAGFHSVWLSERVAIPLDKPHPYLPAVDPWIALAFVAAVTSRVILGTSVSQIALRPPVLMARELATLDRLSGGRLIVGAGAGWVEEEFTSTGVPFETRGGRLNETIRLLRHLWTAPEEPWRGRFFDIPAVGLIKPIRPGGPPIYVGAGAPAGLRRAARYGDGFISVHLPPDSVARLRQNLDSMRVDFGRTGPFPIYTQAPAPPSVDEARKLVEAYSHAGADGLILTYPDPVPDTFLADPKIVRALLEAGA
jgi:probable F420-dependent oxidoreductase